MKLRTDMISEEWDEGDDGYWIALRSGWKWAGDPIGAVHSIHESTRREAHRETVLRCHCSDCEPKPLTVEALRARMR